MYTIQIPSWFLWALDHSRDCTSLYYRRPKKNLYYPLKVIAGWLTLTVFLENITSCACLERSGLKVIFHFYVQWKKFFRPLSSWLAEILGSYTVEDNDVSSANSFTVDSKFSGRSFMYIRKSNGPKIEPCGTQLVLMTSQYTDHYILLVAIYYLKNL